LFQQLYRSAKSRLHPINLNTATELQQVPGSALPRAKILKMRKSYGPFKVWTSAPSKASAQAHGKNAQLFDRGKVLTPEHPQNAPANKREPLPLCVPPHSYNWVYNNW
jgi:hypothetical protein